MHSLKLMFYTFSENQTCRYWIKIYSLWQLSYSLWQNYRTKETSTWCSFVCMNLNCNFSWLHLPHFNCEIVFATIGALVCSTLTTSEKVVVTTKQREGHTIALSSFSNVFNWHGDIGNQLYIQTWGCVP